ncbi:MAG TPA: prephenate dehydrogenase [Bacteroidota bacterium]|nr:prephenate dehydrogenase [Bacteroidota bacterium]
MTLTVVGTGLIGGSIALDLKARGFASRVLGVDADPLHGQQALSLGLVDEVVDLREGISRGDLIVLAVPVNAIVEILPSVLDWTPLQSVVTDVGSTKGAICEAVEGHSRRSRFVPSHPIAGTENSGPPAAITGLFDNRTAIICDEEDCDAQAAEVIRHMYETLGMRVLSMDSDIHDRHIAYVSHISHVVSFALATTVLEIEQSENMIFDLASSGLDSTVRLAKSSPDMWAPILAQNAPYISEALDSYIRHLSRFKELIEDRNEGEAHAFMKGGNEIRRVLDHITVRGESWKQR